MTEAAEIPLAVVGCDFRVASASWRSDVVLSGEERRELTRGLIRDGTISGLVALDTCNRTEWVVSAPEPGWAGQLLRAQMVERWRRARPGVERLPLPYVHAGEVAARHLLRVVAGLESFARGEAEIAGQFHSALETAREEHTISQILNGLGKAAGRVSREACRLGFQHSGRRGVPGLALKLLQDRLPDSADVSVAVIGQGYIGRIVTGLLEEHSSWRVIRVNRTVPSGRVPEIRPLVELGRVTSAADALVVCSGAPEPVLRAEHLEGRDPSGGRPLLVVDLGLPPQVGELSAGRALCFGLDDLPQPDEDPASAAAVRAAVDEGVQLFAHFCAERRLAALLHATQSRHRQFSEETVPRFLDEALPELPEDVRRRVLAGLRGLVREYTNEIFRSIHEVVDESLAPGVGALSPRNGSPRNER